MSRVFITGSADGLGRMAARLLVDEGHHVVLHARSRARADEAMTTVPGAQAAVVGDLSSIEQTRDLVEQVNRLGPFDAVIHNAGVGYRDGHRIITEDRLPDIFAINTLAPYILTALIERPKRLIYIGSGMHRSADTSLKDITWTERSWQANEAYAESKLYVALFAFAVAHRWPEVLSNTVEPGWVATKMGGPGAPDDPDLAHRTQVWLAVSNDQAALVSGRNFYHLGERATAPAVHDHAKQEALLAICRRWSGIALPD